MKDQAYFQAVALKIKTKFADFFKPRTFTVKGSYDPATDSLTEVTETVDAMRDDYNQGQIDGQLIHANDFKILALGAEFTTINPATNGVSVDVDGKECSVVRAMFDPANAMWTLQVRG